VEIHTRARSVHGLDSGGLQIQPEALHSWNATGEHAFRRTRLRRSHLSKLLREFQINRDRSRFVILRCGASDVQERIRPVKIHVPPFQLFQLSPAQARLQRRQIDDPAHGLQRDESPRFFTRERPTLKAGFAVIRDLLDGPQAIPGNTPGALQPIH